jgi:hypothetical protein
MFSKDDGIDDTLEDSTGKLARAIQSQTHWNADAVRYKTNHLR